MSTDQHLDISHTALLAMDCQTGIVSIYAKPEEEFLNRAASVVHAARDASMIVIHVRVGFRPNLPEVSEHNKLFANIKASPKHQKLFEGHSVRSIHGLSMTLALANRSYRRAPLIVLKIVLIVLAWVRHRTRRPALPDGSGC